MWRAHAASPEQVIITTGAQEALNLIARMVLRPGATTAVEDPGYAAAAQVFASHGADLRSVAVDDQGLNPTGLRGLRPSLVYVTPSHPFPTGAVMSLARRRTLIDHCDRHGGVIVEDDYDGEIVFDRPPIAALAALDTTGRTIYVGSFSKTLGAGLRVGYLVVPRRFADSAGDQELDELRPVLARSADPGPLSDVRSLSPARQSVAHRLPPAPGRDHRRVACRVRRWRDNLGW
jgi:GntR family transcriptional regulator/MocR family aminotransferase